MIEVRRETRGDRIAVRQINELAFGRETEANIIDKVRACCDNHVSLVAVDQGRAMGHVLFTPVALSGNVALGMGLAPMAVLPTHQRKGIGSILVRQGLERLRWSGCPFVVVLGHPEYYSRFGFERASHHRIRCQWDGIPDETFMISVFDESKVPKAGGIANYRREFDEAME